MHRGVLSTTTGTAGDGFDVVVVGSGIAGLVAALTAAERGRVAVVTKADAGDCVTAWAQGGIAAALGSDDSAEQHYTDTMAAGRGLCDGRAVRVLVEDAPARVHELAAWGAHFDGATGETPALGREAAHARNRIVHAGGDATGREVERALLDRLSSSGAMLLEHTRVGALVGDDGGRCAGVEVHNAAGEASVISAGAVILASGGAGQLWRTTTNPSVATGDGVAIAYEAGAEVASMEFIQFHPTALDLPGAPHFLLSEAIRGEGAHVIDADGRRFLFDRDPAGELAGRDVVARAIWERLQRQDGAPVLLDCRPLGPQVASRFPTVFRTCLDHGVDIREQPVPIAPAAHYTIGGVCTDIDGATTVPGLFACGEVASTGVHGANRLASNSLIEGMVFGSRAARRAMHDIAERPPREPVERLADAAAAGPAAPDGLDRLREAMWEGCGLLRDAAGLTAASASVDEVRAAAGGSAPAGLALRQSATTAALVCRSALLREESRGAHTRTDHPITSDTWHGVLVMHNNRGHRFDRSS